ncbi:MAG: DUF2723 domain-containing protein, partial [Bacteroidia bacterium]|nr:DUF2723 domain-containing protein [Bacteroidia bacterium]
FIAFLMGLSIGVHLLNLLAIPAIVFVYYFKKYQVNRKGLFLASLVAVVLLGIIMYGIIPGAITMASYFELLFVNGLKMPYNTGILFYGILLLTSLIAGQYFSYSKKRYTGLNSFLFSLSLILLGIPLLVKNLLLVFTLGGVIAFAIYMAFNNKVVMNTILLCCSVILIGYSTFTMIVIRALADPPMDENNPENVFALLSYLNREQYGDRPLFYGQHFNAPVDDRKPYNQGEATYIKKGGKYVIATHKQDYNYVPEYCTFFPRMYSSQREHIEDYLQWTNNEYKNFYNPRIDEEGNVMKNKEGKILYDFNNPKKSPSFGENLAFFFKYQFGFMYFRYFMWNFAGRQNDIQGHGNILHGNWLSGVPFIDKAHLGNQQKITEDANNNKSRNIYYMLPLILGLLGLFFHAEKHNKDFWVIMLLFFFTGIAIVIYLNQYPHQPRERDYAYSASFYAFSIWIGLGVAGLYEYSKKATALCYIYYAAGAGIILCLIALLFKTLTFGYSLFYISLIGAALVGLIMAYGIVIKNNFVRAAVIVIVCLYIPYLLTKNNWDDHDRSSRRTARDFACNYLNSCTKNAILFTNGDNDTFPLWYVQEVEGIRTDVRVINLSLLNTDWYIDQMKRKAYDSDAIPFSLQPHQYVQGTRDYVPIYERLKEYVNIKDAMNFLASDSEEAKLTYPATGEKLNYLPAKNFIIPVDSAKVVSNGTVSPDKVKDILPELRWNINKNYLLKSEIMIFDLIASFDWNRPVYFAITVGNSSYLNLQKYFQLEGLAYRIVPIEDKSPDRYQLGLINSSIMYDNMMNKFVWGGIDDSSVYLDENNLRMTMNFRNNFARLADILLAEGKRDSAIAVLDRCMKLMPDKLVPFNYFNLALADVYYRAKEIEKANSIVKIIAKNTEEELDYYFSLDNKFLEKTDDELTRSMTIYNSLLEILERSKQLELKEELRKKFDKYYESYISTVNPYKR